MPTHLHEAVFKDGRWFVIAVTENDTGTRMASYELELPETATEAELAAAVEALY